MGQFTSAIFIRGIEKVWETGGLIFPWGTSTLGSTPRTRNMDRENIFGKMDVFMKEILRQISSKG